MISNRMFYVCSVLLVLYVGTSSSFIINAILMLSQWLIILIIISIWGTVVKGSIHFGTWFAIGSWFVALIIQQIVVLWIQYKTGSLSGGHFSRTSTLIHDLHEVFVGILLIVPGIPTAYLCSCGLTP